MKRMLVRFTNKCLEINRKLFAIDLHSIFYIVSPIKCGGFEVQRSAVDTHTCSNFANPFRTH